mgnify:FL=1
MPDIAVPVAPNTRVKTLLDMVRRCAFECGVSKDPVNQIESVVDSTEDVGRITGWVISAWRDIQDLEKNWKFMRRSCSFVTVAGQFQYTALQCGITDNTFGRWDLHTFRNYLTAGGVNGEMLMDDLDYDTWRNIYQLGSYRNVTTRPFVVTEMPDLSLGLGPTPLVGYTVIGDYYASPRDLDADTEEPVLNERHNRMGIVGKAMMEYGGSEGAPEVYARGDKMYKSFISRLRRDELPAIRWGGPLA